MQSPSPVTPVKARRASVARNPYLNSSNRCSCWNWILAPWSPNGWGWGHSMPWSPMFSSVKWGWQIHSQPTSCHREGRAGGEQRSNLSRSHLWYYNIVWHFYKTLSQMRLSSLKNDTCTLQELRCKGHRQEANESKQHRAPQSRQFSAHSASLPRPQPLLLQPSHLEKAWKP